MEFKMNKEKDFLYLGEDERKAEAYISFPKSATGSNVIVRVYVDEKFRGQGIASKMMAYLYDYAQENNIILEATCSYAITWLARKK